MWRRISSAFTWSPRSRQGFVEDDCDVHFSFDFDFFWGSNCEETAKRRMICTHAWHNFFALNGFNNHA
jgi:hypothetical protein